MIAVFSGPISRRDDVIDSQWDSRIRRILEAVPDGNQSEPPQSSAHDDFPAGHCDVLIATHLGMWCLPVFLFKPPPQSIALSKV